MGMRVEGAYGAYSVYEVNGTGNAKKTDRMSRAEEKKDSFTLSVQAEDYQAVRRALAGVPDIRADKVDPIKAKIEAGQYFVGTGEVAGSILKYLGE